MKPSCAILNPMTQMIRLFAAASTQPSQHLLPTRIVENTVSTQDRQSSRYTSESISNFISTIFSRMVWLVLRSRLRRRNPGNLRRSVWLNSMLRKGEGGTNLLLGAMAGKRSLVAREFPYDLCS